jgi:hypothetical protein
MDDDKHRVEKKKAEYSNLADPAGAVGRMTAAKRPNSGRANDPEEVLKIFRADHKQHQSVQDKVIADFGQTSPKKS